MEIVANVSRWLTCRAPLGSVYALLADVPRSISHFPDVESVVPVGDAWQWRLRELGAGPIRFQVSYANRYHVDPGAQRVWWERVPGYGNTAVDGRWILTAEGTHTRIAMEARFVIDTPFPRFLRPAVAAVVDHQNERLIGAYMRSLVATLEG